MYMACDIPTDALKLVAVRLMRVRRRNFMRRRRRTSLKSRGNLEKPATSLTSGVIHWYLFTHQNDTYNPLIF